MITIEVDVSEVMAKLTRLGPRVRLLTRRAVEDTCGHAANVARATRAFQDRTGRLRTSIRSGIIEDEPSHVTGALSAGDPAPGAHYAQFVELGTRRHDIYPRDRQALYWPGAEHPVRHVRHPGTRPRPFIQPAMLQAALLEKVFETTLKALFDAEG